MRSFAGETARRWRNTPVHRQVDKHRSRWVWKVVLGAAIALSPLAVYLLQTMAFVQTSYAVEDLRSKEARLSEAERRLRIDKANLESLPNVERRASRELGLEPAPAAHVVVVSPGEIPSSARPSAPRSATGPR